MRVFSNAAPQIKKKPASAKAVLFVRNNKILLLKKANGAWDLPGGKLKSGEGWIEGLTREVFEESGLRIRNADWVSGWSNGRHPKKSMIMGFFVCQLNCKPKKSRIVISDEHVKGKFFSFNKVKGLALPQEYARVIKLAAQKINP